MRVIRVPPDLDIEALALPQLLLAPEWARSHHLGSTANIRLVYGNGDGINRNGIHPDAGVHFTHGPLGYDFLYLVLVILAFLSVVASVVDYHTTYRRMIIVCLQSVLGLFRDMVEQFLGVIYTIYVLIRVFVVFPVWVIYQYGMKPVFRLISMVIRLVFVVPGRFFLRQAVKHFRIILILAAYVTFSSPAALAIALRLSKDWEALLRTLGTGIGVFTPTNTLAEGVTFVKDDSMMAHYAEVCGEALLAVWVYFYGHREARVLIQTPRTQRMLAVCGATVNLLSPWLLPSYRVCKPYLVKSLPHLIWLLEHRRPVLFAAFFISTLVINIVSFYRICCAFAVRAKRSAAYHAVTNATVDDVVGWMVRKAVAVKLNMDLMRARFFKLLPYIATAYIVFIVHAYRLRDPGLGPFGTGSGLVVYEKFVYPRPDYGVEWWGMETCPAIFDMDDLEDSSQLTVPHRELLATSTAVVNFCSRALLDAMTARTGLRGLDDFCIQIAQSSAAFQAGSPLWFFVDAARAFALKLGPSFVSPVALEGLDMRFKSPTAALVYFGPIAPLSMSVLGFAPSKFYDAPLGDGSAIGDGFNSSTGFVGGSADLTLQMGTGFVSFEGGAMKGNTAEDILEVHDGLVLQATSMLQDDFKRLSASSALGNASFVKAATHESSNVSVERISTSGNASIVLNMIDKESEVFGQAMHPSVEEDSDFRLALESPSSDATRVMASAPAAPS
ncbi:hypothetical protein SCHPADRAFT_941200 [Schizopora paradoxa]|uniref:Transmembrane protein n=1 Tax=Schizopora paradoxa TaxID=27342 RepID=A0A0H2RKR5_9AGAM|nr:hypothetical protein SCHPADRAFT_941200 [Schizopora paradoxa]